MEFVDPPKNPIPLRRRLIAEALGTFVLVFAGTGAIVVNDITHAVTHVGIALTFGLVVLALIQALGDISGAHFNPAVTIGFVAARRFPLTEALPYILTQLVGATAASCAIAAIFPDSRLLGGTMPLRGEWQPSFVLEVFLTAFLMFVVLNISTGAKEKGLTAGITVGAVIGLEALFAGPICGASMNPARSFGPAIVSGEVGFLWLYFVAPMVGALIAVPCCCSVQESGCCSGTPAEEKACP